MTTTVRIAVSIQKTLFDQAESLARQFNISPNHLFGVAIEYFVKNYPSQALRDEINRADEQQPDPAAMQIGGRKEINQGDVYWVPLAEPSGLEPGYTHPHVVVQADVFNHSRLNTVVVCALSTNLKRAKSPGHVLLDSGEANLPKQSVVVVSQVSTVDKTQLGEYIGTLTRQRVSQILAGMRFLQSLTERRETGDEGQFRDADQQSDL